MEVRISLPTNSEQTRTSSALPLPALPPPCHSRPTSQDAFTHCFSLGQFLQSNGAATHRPVLPLQCTPFSWVGGWGESFLLGKLCGSSWGVDFMAAQPSCSRILGKVRGDRSRASAKQTGVESGAAQETLSRLTSNVQRTKGKLCPCERVTALQLAH